MLTGLDDPSSILDAVPDLPARVSPPPMVVDLTVRVKFLAFCISLISMISFRHQPPLVLAGSNAALAVQPQKSKIPSIPIPSPLESEKPLANHHLKDSRRCSKQVIQTNSREQVASISYNHLKVKRRHKVRHSQRRSALREEGPIHLWASFLQDIQEKNILLDLRLDDISVLEAFEQELTTPVPEKLQETGSSIHFSRLFCRITAGPCSATLVKPGLGERCTPMTSSHTNIAPQGLYSMYHGDGRSISGLLV